ncbi:VOC family protein [Nocardioides sp. cx-169]|uniref:VOC family protein n=1 Tax=Nocardioides sp. cx-169 TaxID=2899080 RepID=UPI001E5D77B4|nr:VOC family protein [Nocardioides sp. cx-169]MCD4533063.1 VOC family protein [Nocardioides sp. cx-169]
MRELSDLFRNFVQVGYVTDDIDAATAFLEAKLGTVTCVTHYGSSLGGGTPPSDPDAPRSPFVVVGGQPADEWVIDVALVNSGPTNLEVIRPVSGSVDLYRGAIRPNEAATIHHLGFMVDDFDAATAVVEKSGRSWAQWGDSGGIRFGYLDMTAELGHYVEVMEADESEGKLFAQLEAASNAARD